VLIISGDLSHVHDFDRTTISNPLYHTGATIPTDDKIAKHFDELIEKWVLTLDQNILLSQCGPIEPKALSCGFLNYIVLQQILHSISKTEDPNALKDEWKSEVLAREAPTYYGKRIIVCSIYRTEIFCCERNDCCLHRKKASEKTITAEEHWI
jgi:hypothetical protein